MSPSSRFSTSFWRLLALLLGLATIASWAFVWWLLRGPEAPAVEVPGAGIERPARIEREPELTLRAASFGELPGWEEDSASEARPALATSCARLLRLPAERELGPGGVAGTAGDWRPFCRGLEALPAGDDAALRELIERELRPWSAADAAQTALPGSRRSQRAADDALAAALAEPEVGLFTGYYEPTLRGSLRRRGEFTTPLYRRPPEMLQVELGDFRDDLAGRRIAGRIAGGRLVPFHDREAIDEGALAGRGLELVWVDDPVAAFFLHVQGSGRVELAEGGALRVGYAGQNGHPYHAIGRELVERGELERSEVSLQSIRAWLEEHPDEMREILHSNPSYVFFRRLSESGPLGAEGTVLTPGRSLAVDRRFHALGVPMWLDSSYPADPSAPPPALAGPPLRRLLVAQDTGGAIRGPVRGDVFWGPGAEAEAIAGRMRQPGRLWVLLPKTVAAS